MTTKAPASVKPAPAGSLEELAYGSVAGIPFAEPHDRDRLGYCMYLWLSHSKDPLDVAIKAAKVHMQISEEEALERIREYLVSYGVKL